MDVINKTDFGFFSFPHSNMHGFLITVCLVTASVKFDDKKNSRTIVELAEPILEDQYIASPEKSSMVVESDLVTFKPNTDIVFSSENAYSPSSSDEEQWPVHLKVGDLEKELVVYGDRKFRKGLFGKWRLMETAPASRRKIQYEHAYGGSQTKNGEYQQFPENPIGTAHYSNETTEEILAPTIEYPGETTRQIGSTCKPAGLGPIPRTWEPRTSLSGTYDEVWKKERWPLWPEDLNMDFFCCAPEDQQYAGYVNGDEKIELTNLTPSRNCSFQLPFAQTPFVSGVDEAGKECHGKAKLDTIRIDLDNLKLTCVWRTALLIADPSFIYVRNVG